MIGEQVVYLQIACSSKATLLLPKAKMFRDMTQTGKNVRLCQA